MILPAVRMVHRWRDVRVSIRRSVVVLLLSVALACNGTGPSPTSQSPLGQPMPAPPTLPNPTALEAVTHARSIYGSAPILRISTEGDIPLSGRIPNYGRWFVTFATRDPATVSQWRIAGTGQTTVVNMPSDCFMTAGGFATMDRPTVDSGRALELALPDFVQWYGSRITSESAFLVKYLRRPDGASVVEIRAAFDVRRLCDLDKVQLDAMTGATLVVELSCRSAPPSMRPFYEYCRGA